MRTTLTLSALAFVCSVLAQPGTLDPSFSGDGFLSTSYTETGTFAPNRSVATTDGGHITAITRSTSFSLLKFDASGSQNGQPSAADQQYSDGADISVASNLIALANGKFLVAGNCQVSSGYRVALARYNADLSRDITFGTNGSTLVDLGTALQEVRCIVALSDGRYMIGGAQSTFGNQPSMAFVMFTNNGTVDATWGNGGIQVATPPGYWAYARDMVQLPGGGFLVVGGFYDQTNNFHFDVITRLTSAGAVDTSFDGDGFIGNSGGSFYRDLLLNDDGSFYALRRSRLDFTTGPELERRQSTGALDAAFDGDGVVDLQPQFGYEGDVNGMEVDASGRILVCGQVINALGTNSAALVRLMPEGSIDPNFGTSGMFTQASSSTSQYYSFYPLLKGNSILLTGVNNSNFGDRLLCYLQVFNDVNVNVQSNDDAESFKLWPNPAMEQLTIGADGNMEFRSVGVFDVAGACVLSHQGNLHAPFSIDLRALSSGPYILQVEGPGGRVSQSFLKN
jgi:uncharacterized delta-60 repeat protein